MKTVWEYGSMGVRVDTVQVSSIIEGNDAGMATFL